jgi:hypothetical protein
VTYSWKRAPSATQFVQMPTTIGGEFQQNLPRGGRWTLYSSDPCVESMITCPTTQLLMTLYFIKYLFKLPVQEPSWRKFQQTCVLSVDTPSSFGNGRKKSLNVSDNTEQHSPLRPMMRPYGVSGPPKIYVSLLNFPVTPAFRHHGVRSPHCLLASGGWATTPLTGQILMGCGILTHTHSLFLYSGLPFLQISLWRDYGLV